MADARKENDSIEKDGSRYAITRTVERELVSQIAKILCMPAHVSITLVSKVNVLKEALSTIRKIKKAKQREEVPVDWNVKSNDHDESTKRSKNEKNHERLDEETYYLLQMGSLLMDMSKKPTKAKILEEVVKFLNTPAELTPVIECSEEYWIRLEYLPDVKTPDAGPMIVESDGRIRLVAGYSVQDVLKKNAFGFIHPEDIPHVIIDLRQMLSKRSGNTSYRLRMKNDEYIYLRTSGYLLSNPKEKITKFICINFLLSREQGAVAIRKAKERYSVWFGEVENDDKFVDKLVTDPQIWHEFTQNTSGSQPAAPSTASVADFELFSEDIDDVSL